MLGWSLAATVFAACGTGPVAAAANGPAEPGFRGELAGVLDAAGEGERVPVSIVLRERGESPRRGDMRGLPKGERRRLMIDHLRATAARSQAALLGRLGAAAARGEASDIHALWVHNVVAARVTRGLAREIAARDDVAYINYDRPVGAEVFPDAPGEGEGWGRSVVECGVATMRAPEAWTGLGIDGAGVLVAQIDTGICLGHPDIAGRVWVNPGEIEGNGIDDEGNGFIDDIHGWNFRDESPNIDDDHWHGSHTAGSIAGTGAGGTQCGVAPGATVMPLKFWDDITAESLVWAAMQYALDNGADMISASLGWSYIYHPDRATWRAVSESLFDAGMVCVFAAGNEGWRPPYDAIRTPADVPDMIAVGATDCNLLVMDFSSRGPVTWQDIDPYNDWPWPPGLIKPTVVGPGNQSVSHNLCQAYYPRSGTSMSTPHVAGAVALVLSANPSLDQWDVRAVLEETAIDLIPAGPDIASGAGFVDAYAAVERALALSCEADANGDGIVDTRDVLVFLGWFAAGDPRADANRDGIVDSRDVLAFLNLWAVGCG